MRHPLGRLVALIALIVAVAATAVACSGSDSAGDTTAPTPDGATAFAQWCAACHGADLSGTGSGPSLLSEVYEPGHHPDESFRSAVRNGVSSHHWGFGDMPALPGVSDAELDALIRFVRDTQAAEGFEPYPPS